MSTKISDRISVNDLLDTPDYTLDIKQKDGIPK